MITEKKIDDWIKRKSIPVYYKYKEKANIWDKTKKDVDFKFYRCDFCGAAIVIKNKYSDQDGGEFELKPTRLRRGSAKLVVHNICLNKMLKELDKFWEEKDREK